MHIPDGFIDAPISLAAGAVAVAGVAVCARQSAAIMTERQAPLAGLVAAFVFAVQMLNFPVAAGTSGHLIGGVLAAVLVGPWTGVLCITVVLVVQALLFADGGLSALGLNVLNMALITVGVGYATFVLVRRAATAIGSGEMPAVVGATAIAALVSVPIAALAFAIEYTLGGTGGASPVTVATAMGGVHVLIGLGEAVISASTVAAVMSVRPDLVYGATGTLEHSDGA
jgi:cobalamin biosynthesis protein CbiM